MARTHALVPETARLFVVSPTLRRWAAALAAGLVLGASSAGATPSFTGLGKDFGANVSVTADGSTVLGSSYRWTAATGTVTLPYSLFVGILGANSDGTVLAVMDPNCLSALWTQSGGFVRMPVDPTTVSGVSGDGTVVYGTGGRTGWTWTQAGWQSLPGLPGATLGWAGAYGASYDGSVIVGTARNASGGFEAYRYQGGVTAGLGDLAGGSINSSAFGVSADGSVVVGYGTTTAGQEAFRWTAAGGMVSLGDLPGGAVDSRAYAVSDDGVVVVGGSDSKAFVWDETNGMRNLAQALADAGLGAALQDWTLTTALAVSPDGRTIVGDGYGPNGYETWVATLDRPGAAGSDPVPEPATNVLLGTGLLGLAAVVRRRSRQQAVSASAEKGGSR